MPLVTQVKTESCKPVKLMQCSWKSNRDCRYSMEVLILLSRSPDHLYIFQEVVKMEKKERTDREEREE